MDKWIKYPTLLGIIILTVATIPVTLAVHEEDNFEISTRDEWWGATQFLDDTYVENDFIRRDGYARLQIFENLTPEKVEGAQNTEINTWRDLERVRDNLNGTYHLGSDLTPETEGYDQYAGPDANDGKGWDPIGQKTGFEGTFNGKGYEIRGLYIDRPLEDNVGLFGYIGDDNVSTKVENIYLLDVDITGDNRVGSLAGNVQGYSNDLIRNCQVRYGKVRGLYNVGGLVGDLRSLRSDDSSKNDPTVNRCFANVEVHGIDGGIGRFGGLVGCGEKSNILNSYTHSNVFAENARYVGGLTGNVFNNGTAENTYATGHVYGDTYVGGLVGAPLDLTSEDGEVINSYWDNTASNQDNSAAGVAKTTEELFRENTYGWNFETTWEMGDNTGYWVSKKLSNFETYDGEESFVSLDTVFHPENSDNSQVRIVTYNEFGSITSDTGYFQLENQITDNNAEIENLEPAYYHQIIFKLTGGGSVSPEINSTTLTVAETGGHAGTGAHPAFFSVLFAMAWIFTIIMLITRDNGAGSLFAVFTIIVWLVVAVLAPVIKEPYVQVVENSTGAENIVTGVQTVSYNSSLSYLAIGMMFFALFWLFYQNFEWIKDLISSDGDGSYDSEGF